LPIKFCPIIYLKTITQMLIRTTCFRERAKQHLRLKTSFVKTNLRFFDRRVSHGGDVKDKVLVPTFDQNETVFGVKAAVELGLGQVEVDEAGRVLERVFVVLQLAEGAKDDHVGELAGRALKIFQLLT
jgi:hypothetical protein